MCSRLGDRSPTVGRHRVCLRRVGGRGTFGECLRTISVFERSCMCSGGDQFIWCLQVSLHLGALHPQSDCLRNLVSARIQVFKSILRLFSIWCTTYYIASLSRSEGQICPIQPALSVFICSLLHFFLVWRRFTRSCAIFSVASGISAWRLHSGSQLVVISFCMASRSDRFSCGFTRHWGRCSGVSGRIR